MASSKVEAFENGIFLVSFMRMDMVMINEMRVSQQWASRGPANIASFKGDSCFPRNMSQYAKFIAVEAVMVSFGSSFAEIEGFS